MQFDIKRYKILDWAIVAIFVVAIVGVSLPWWHVKAPSGEGGKLLGDFGISMPSVNFNGWAKEVVGTGRATFVFSLIALLVVAAKALLPAGALPSWYKESFLLLGIGGLCTLLGLIGCLVPPQGGYKAWAWSLGGILTFLAAAALFGAGYLMLKDKSGDYDGQGQFKLPSFGAPPAGSK